MNDFQFNFEWDPKKAKINISKHKISFELASKLFFDPMMLSIFDESHSEYEDRWISLGIAKNGSLLVIHHSFDQTDENCVSIRIISSRKATKKEQEQYKDQ